MFFKRKGPVWETLRDLQTRLDDAKIEYVIIGGMALNAFNYPRQTADVDVVLTEPGFAEFKRRYVEAVYRRAEGPARRFLDPNSEVTVDILISGELAGKRGRNPSVRFPEPSEAELHGDLRTVSLARLIELKLVTWRYKDWGDVVELIRRNGLEDSFADRLDPIVRSAYGECHDQAHDEEYEGPADT